MDKGEKYLSDLEELLSKMLRPLKKVPFNLVIKGFSGHNLIPFDTSNPDDEILLEDLRNAAEMAAETAFGEGIISSRPNEVGNYMEPYVIDAINSIGLNADKPRTTSGKKLSTGYPDIFIIDRSERPSYLEVKTYNIKNYQTTQRSFYVSPSSTEGGFKVTCDARHLVLTFQIEKTERNSKSIFVPVYWKIVSIDDLQGQIKHEFNASNRQMYRNSAILAEGSVSSRRSFFN